MKSESSGAVVKATPRQLAGIVAAVIVLVGMHFVPTTEMMPLAARNTLGVLIAVIILLVCETFPFGITCLTAISLLYFFKCIASRFILSVVFRLFQSLGGYISYFVAVAEKQRRIYLIKFRTIVFR